MQSAYNEDYLRLIVENDERNFLIASLVRKMYERDKYIIVLVTRIRHLKVLSNALRDIPHRIISGTYDGKGVALNDRIVAKKKFELGKIRLIIANSVFKKGVDIKRVDCIIDAAAGSSSNDAVQKFGRGIRLHELKDGLLYFDISDYDEKNDKNYFDRASRLRERALRRVGITTHTVCWESDSDTGRIVDKSEKWLRKLLTSTP